MINRRSRSHWLSQRFVWLVLVFACLGLMPQHATAAVSLVCLRATPVATVTLPPVTVTAGAPIGSMLGSPVSVSVGEACPSATAINSATVQVGILAPGAAVTAPHGGIALQTNYPGIAVVMTASPIQASSSICAGCGPNGTPGWAAATVTSANSATFTVTLQLMKTGPIAAGTLGQVDLAQVYYQSGNTSTASVGPQNTITLSSTAISVQACSVNTDSSNLRVNLPTVSTQALKTATAVAGRTRFNVNLTCQPGANVSIAITPSAAGSATGTIANAGTAKNVNVQLLDGGLNAVTFSTVTPLGAAPSGPLSIPYYAQYYATGTVGAGSVTASATFTMTYQ